MVVAIKKSLASLALCAGLFVCLAAPGSAQSDILRLDDALRLAKERNGTAKSAFLSYQAAESGVRAAASSFLPSLTPTFRYDNRRTQFFTGPQAGRSQNNSRAFDITASYKILDTGERDAAYRSSRFSAEARRLSALQTLRGVLFQVHRQYYEALRTRALYRVASAQLERTQKIYDQTKTRIELGDAAPKDLLQANADLLNAKAAMLNAETRVATADAELKATIGWDPNKDLPAIEEVPIMKPASTAEPLQQYFERGLKQRPDLQANRRGLDASRASVRLAEIDAGINFSVDASFSKSLSPNVSDQSLLSFVATIPLYDGQRSKENLKSRRFDLLSQVELLIQSEREILSEIEASYKQYAQNQLRLVATSAALEAAITNYNAAEEAQKAGAANLIEVITAQASLVTAESNNVESTYDTLISGLQLRLSTGEPMPGENT